MSGGGGRCKPVSGDGVVDGGLQHAAERRGVQSHCTLPSPPLPPSLPVG